MRKSSLSLLGLLIPSFFACNTSFNGDKSDNGDSTNSVGKELMTDDERSSTGISESVNQQAFGLYRLNNTEEDFIFSPLSINSAFGMLYFGAAGNTKTEMQKTFHFHEDVKKQGLQYQKESESLKDAPLTMANNIWVEKELTLKDSFLQSVTEYYGAEIQSSNFKKNFEHERIMINRWVSQATKDNITNLLPEESLDDQTRSVLVNAIYFKGSWVSGFTLEDDKSPFSNGEKSIQVQYIEKTKHKFLYTDNETMKMVNVPFEKDFSIDIILPKGDISEFEKEFTLDNYQTWTSLLKEQELDLLKLPKFKQAHDLQLTPQLKSLGLKDAFKDRVADFNDMTNDRDQLYISNVFHKATIDLNEQGAEAAAATAIETCGEESFLEPTNPSMNVNKPFIYIIKNDKTKTIAFIGKVSNPSYE